MSKRRRQRRRGRMALLILIVVVIIIFGVGIHHKTSVQKMEEQTSASDIPDYIDVQLLDVNEYSRPGIALKRVNGIVVHYTANPGSTAQQNRDYFNNLQVSHTTKVSSHFVIGIDGEVIQCIPTKEMAYASHPRNSDTIAIECCHKSEDGAFTKETYDSLVKLTAYLCNKYDLTGEDVIRHYDVSGKKCPLYYVEHPEEWETFREDVDAARREQAQQ